MRGFKSKASLLWGLGLFLLIVACFEILPLLSVIFDSFRKTDGSGFTLENYASSLSKTFYLQSITSSLYISLLSSLVGIIAAVLGAYSLHNLPPKARDRILTFSNMTSNFAGVPLAFAFIIILGNNGLFTLLFKNLGWDMAQRFNLYSISGLVIVYIYFQIPLGILLMYPAFDAIRNEWKEAALILGADAAKFWRHIGLPVLLPGIVGTFNILFANAMGAYATAVALTNGSINLLPIRIGALISGDIMLNPELASALSVVLGVTLVLINVINRKLLGRREAA